MKKYNGIYLTVVQLVSSDFSTTGGYEGYSSSDDVVYYDSENDLYYIFCGDVGQHNLVKEEATRQDVINYFEETAEGLPR